LALRLRQYNMLEVDIVKWIVIALLSVGGFFIKRTIDKLEEDAADMKHELQKVKEDYLHKSDFREFKTELRSMFEEIRSDLRSLQK
jgi:hypothetical protein